MLHPKRRIHLFAFFAFSCGCFLLSGGWPQESTKSTKKRRRKQRAFTSLCSCVLLRPLPLDRRVAAKEHKERKEEREAAA